MPEKKGPNLVCPICEASVKPPTYDALNQHILQRHPDLWQLLEERPSAESKETMPYIR